jgi:hypothetical protein
MFEVSGGPPRRWVFVCLLCGRQGVSWSHRRGYLAALRHKRHQHS